MCTTYICVLLQIISFQGTLNQRLLVPLFDLTTHIGLDPALQLFNVISMYQKDNSEFSGIFECSADNGDLAVKQCLQKSRIRLGSGVLIPSETGDEDAAQSEKDATTTFRLCSVDQFLFFVSNLDSQEVVLFGRRKGNSCGET